MDLPAAVAAYFAAGNAEDSDEVAGQFTPDAVVRDEGTSHRGHEAIRDWHRATRQRYHAVAEPFGEERSGDVLVVRAKVTGSFQGSPIDLSFRFGLAGALIGELEIGL
jgi:ketosteroid isomerase-like protein